jgi:hypothetical protein
VRPIIESNLRTTAVLAAAVALALGSADPAVGAEPVVAAAERGAPSDRTEIPAAVLDILVLRPLAAAATVAGLPMFIASVPFVAASGELLTSWDVFVLAPADYTFRRPLGDF